MTRSLTLKWVAEATSGFVNAEQMQEAVSLALAGGLNMLLSGPGGHGKSELYGAVFGTVEGIEPFIKSLGQGTTTEELFGGIDFDALNRKEGATIQFNPEQSFLPHEIVVFEELFDAPARVLTALKDTMTARELRNGAQRYPMKTSIIAAATNHSPQEIAELGPAVAALVERFPIQLEVVWHDYGAEAFLHLFTTTAAAEDNERTPVTWEQVAELQGKSKQVKVGKTTTQVLAHVLADLRKEKVTISPRTAMLARKLVQAAAAINDRDHALAADVQAVTYLPGCQKMDEQIAELVKEYDDMFGAEEKADRAEAYIKELTGLLSGATSLEQYREIRRVFDMAHEEVRQIRGADSLRQRLNDLHQQYERLNRTLLNNIKSLEEKEALEKAAVLIAKAEEELHRYGTLLAATDDTDRLTEYRDDLIELNQTLNKALGSDQMVRYKISSLQVSVRELISDYSQKVRSADRRGWSW